MHTLLRELPFIIIIILIAAVQQWIERVVPHFFSHSLPHLFITLSFRVDRFDGDNPFLGCAFH